MQVLRFGIGLAAAVAIHTLGPRLVPEFSHVVDVFLVVTVLQGLTGNSLVGMVGGLVAGLTHDALTGAPFGLYGFADTLVGYVTARLAQRLVIQRAFGVGLVVAGFVWLQQLSVVLVQLLAAPPVAWPSPGWWLLRSVVAGCLGGMLVFLQSLWQRGRASQKQRRTRRLRMD